MTFSRHNCSTLDFLQASLDNYNQFLKTNNSSFENRLLSLERAYLHLIYNFFLNLFSKLTDGGILFEGPPNEVFESHLIDIISHYPVQSVPAKHQAYDIFISLYGILPHSIVIQRLLPEGISFCQFSLELRCLIDWCASFLDVIESWSRISFLNDDLALVKLLTYQRRGDDIFLVRSEVGEKSDTFEAFFVLCILSDNHFLDCMSEGDPINNPEITVWQCDNLAISRCVVK